MSLLKTRRFLPLLITQFLGALNDNLFKNALLTMVALKMTAQSDVLSNVIAGLFILPFFLPRRANLLTNIIVISLPVS